MALGAYHFFRPWLNKASIVSQAQFFLDTIANQPIKFLAVDLESYTNDPASLVSAIDYSRRAKILANYLSSNSPLPVLIYTRLEFIDNNCKPVYDWLGNYDLWLAHWRYQSPDYHVKPIKVSWTELNASHLPPFAGPDLPTSNPDWRIWQWTGEKFILPGISTLIDLNFYNGTKVDFYQWAKFSADECTAHSEPGDPTLPHKVRVLAIIQVHSSPGMDTPVVGSLDQTAQLTAIDVCIKDGDKYAKIGDNQWIAMRFKDINFSDWGG